MCARVTRCACVNEHICVHVYMTLRRWAASGKGTIGKRLALELQLAHLDTGSLYRATALRMVCVCKCVHMCMCTCIHACVWQMQGTHVCAVATIGWHPPTMSGLFCNRPLFRGPPLPEPKIVKSLLRCHGDTGVVSDLALFLKCCVIEC